MILAGSFSYHNDKIYVIQLNPNMDIRIANSGTLGIAILYFTDSLASIYFFEITGIYVIEFLYLL